MIDGAGFWYEVARYYVMRLEHYGVVNANCGTPAFANAPQFTIYKIYILRAVHFKSAFYVGVGIVVCFFGACYNNNCNVAAICHLNIRPCICASSQTANC